MINDRDRADAYLLGWLLQAVDPAALDDIRLHLIELQAATTVEYRAIAIRLIDAELARKASHGLSAEGP